MRIIGNDPSTPRQAQIVASGTLSTGDTVVINADGTVSSITSNSVTETAGSAAVFESATVRAIYGAYDSNLNRVVFFYWDEGNTNYPTAVVGTVSGTSISFGTPVVVTSNEGYSETIPAAFDSSANKIVFAYTNSSYHGTAIVGTVSGTSISFGTPTVFDTSIFILGDAAMAYDSENNKIVIVYQKYAIVGTVSGTSISFGSRTTFRTTTVGDNSISYDPVAGKVVVVFSVNAGSPTFQGEAIVGTVSGTSISFGTAVSFESRSSVSNFDVAYHSASGQHIVAYNLSGTGSGEAIALTVSGTSVTYGSPQNLVSGSTNYSKVVDHTASGKVVILFFHDTKVKAVSATVDGTNISFDTPFVLNPYTTFAIAGVYAPDQGTIAVGYRNANNSNYGTSKVYRPGYDSTNLTSENYIGTAATGAPGGIRAKINLKGAVDENQSSLTAGQSYYVQIDGTLDATPDNPSVFAGTAVAANKLIVKG